jgi:hypothetical protein
MCDCYATTDPVAEMGRMAQLSGDPEESAVKWLALAMLHGVNSQAREISIALDESGCVRVKSERPDCDLPPPDAKIADAVMDAVRDITHIEEDKGSLPVSIGIRDGSINVLVKVKSKGERDKVAFLFDAGERRHHRDDGHSRDGHHRSHHGRHHH